MRVARSTSAALRKEQPSAPLTYAAAVSTLINPSDRHPPETLAGASFERRATMSRAQLLRSLILLVAGAMPVLSIPLAVMGVISMTEEALFLVIPLAILTMVLMAHGSPESVWALKGLIAGLVAVSAYDAMRIPMIIAGVWPDFIPHLGGWVLGIDRGDLFIGYLWRYLGDGGGIGMAFFVFCRLVAAVRPSLITAQPMLLSIGYGIFIWFGLCATVVVIPNGSNMLFAMSPVNFTLSLVGHLIYGAVLGLFLAKAVPHLSIESTSRKSGVVGTDNPWCSSCGTHGRELNTQPMPIGEEFHGRVPRWIKTGPNRLHG